MLPAINTIITDPDLTRFEKFKKISTDYSWAVGLTDLKRLLGIAGNPWKDDFEKDKQEAYKKVMVKIEKMDVWPLDAVAKMLDVNKSTIRRTWVEKHNLKIGKWEYIETRELKRIFAIQVKDGKWNWMAQKKW